MSGKIIVVNELIDQELQDKIKEAAAKYDYTCAFFNSEEKALPYAPEADIIYGRGLELVKKADHLKWIHIPWAGVDPYIVPGVIREGCLLSNSAGAYGVTVSEHMVMMTLMLLRGEMVFAENMRKKDWSSPIPQKTIKESRVLVLGAGDIGKCYARRLRPFEPASLIGVSRSGRGEDPCFDKVVPVSEVDTYLPDCDILAMCLPSTPDTVDFMDEKRLRSLKKGAYIVNVGRGTAIDEAVLKELLENETLSGAALDVFRHEPLPENDPLWGTKNLLMTPHVAGNLTARYTLWKNVDMFCEDLANFAEGRPMRYLVDRVHGY